MKKGWKIVLILVIVILIIYVLQKSFNIFEGEKEKELYISCNNISDSYEVYNNEKIHFASSDDKCKLNLEVRNIDRNFIKLNSTLYLYKVDKNMEVTDGSLSNEIFVAPNDKLILLSMDKNTRFIFEYK